METRYTLLVLYGDNPPVIGEYPSRRDNHVQLSGIYRCHDAKEQLNMALKSHV